MLVVKNVSAKEKVLTIFTMSTFLYTSNWHFVNKEHISIALTDQLTAIKCEAFLYHKPQVSSHLFIIIRYHREKQLYLAV